MKSRIDLVIITVLMMAISEVLVVQAHTDVPDKNVGLIAYVAIISFITFVVFAAIFALKKYETVPGTIPVKKFAIAAIIAIVINSLIFGYIYRSVIFY